MLLETSYDDIVENNKNKLNPIIFISICSNIFENHINNN